MRHPTSTHPARRPWRHRRPAANRLSSAVWLAAWLSVIGLSITPAPAQVSPPRELTVIAGFATPESVAFDQQGRVYVSNIGEFSADEPDGDGRIVQLDAAGMILADPFASGLNDPKGLAFDARGRLVVSDIDRLWRIDGEGNVALFAGPDAFPATPEFLNDVAADPAGGAWVSDSSAGRLFHVSDDGAVTLAEEELAGINGLVVDAMGALLIAVDDRILRRTAPGEFELVADGFRALDGLAFDAAGALYASEFSAGRVTRIKPDGARDIVIENQASSADLGINPVDNVLWVPNFRDDTMLRLPLAMDAAPAAGLILGLSPESGPVDGDALTLRFILEPLADLDVDTLRIDVGDTLTLNVDDLAALLSSGFGTLEIDGQLATLEFADIPFPFPGVPLPLSLRFQASTLAGDVTSIEREYTR